MNQHTSAWRRSRLTASVIATIAIAAFGVASPTDAHDSAMYEQGTAAPALRWARATPFAVWSVAEVDSGGAVIARYAANRRAYVLERYSKSGHLMWRVRGPRLVQKDGSGVGADAASVTTTNRAIFVVGTAYGPSLERDTGLTVASYTLSGELRWRRSLRTGEAWEVPSGIAAWGRVVAVSAYVRNQGEGWVRNGFVLGLSRQGKSLWTNPLTVRNWPGNGVQPEDIAGGRHGFYVAGSVIAESQAGAWAPEHAIFVQAINKRGATRWTRTTEVDSRADFDRALAVASARGRIAVAGYVDAVPRGEYLKTSQPHAWVAAYSVAGRFLWSDRSPRIARWETVDQLQRNHVVVAGSGRTRWDGAAGRPLMRELTGSGRLQWTVTIRQPTADQPPWPTDLTHGSGRLYVATTNGLASYRR